MFKTVKRIINWMHPYKKRLYLGFVLAFVNGIFIVLPVILTALSLDQIISDANGSRQIQNRDIWLMSLFMLGAVTGRYFVTYIRSRCQESVGYEFLAEKRIEIGIMLKRVPLGFFNKNTTGEIVSATTTDMSFIELHLMNVINMAVNGYITMAVMIISLLFFDPVLFAIAICGILLSSFFLWRLHIASNRSAPIHQAAQNSIIAATIEYIRGIAMVKSFNQGGVSYKGIKKAYDESKKININIEKHYVLFNTLHQFSLKIASVAIVLWAGYQFLQGLMGLPITVMLSIFSFIIFSNAEVLSGAIHGLQIINKMLDKIESIEKTEFIDKDGKDIVPDSTDISFDSVSFAYEDKLVIRDTSFDIPAQRTTAIVGPSGSGKTTLVKLIARFYDVNKGSIRLGFHDLREFTCDSLLKNISMVFQDVYLFNDTVLNNIKFGKPDATMDEVIDAAKKARCHDFIMELPDQYDTVVNEQGASLSGGEKQRISIARAILKDAPVIILDEATASIDPENEQYIQQAITSLISDKTVIIIAHRLATIENADQIIVMDDGRVADIGTHEELIMKDGIYKGFVDIRKKAEAWSIV